MRLMLRSEFNTTQLHCQECTTHLHTSGAAIRWSNCKAGRMPPPFVTTRFFVRIRLTWRQVYNGMLYLSRITIRAFYALMSMMNYPLKDSIHSMQTARASLTGRSKRLATYGAAPNMLILPESRRATRNAKISFFSSAVTIFPCRLS